MTVCIHGYIKYGCKICYDPVKVTFHRIIINSKEADTNHWRGIYRCQLLETDWVSEEGLTEDFLFELMEDQTIEEDVCCFKCGKTMQFDHLNHDLCTIDRVNSNLFHTIDNVVFSCHECNCGPYLKEKYGFYPMQKGSNFLRGRK